MRNGYKILIVDDEEDILEIVGFNLRKEGYDVYTALNADKAMELAMRHIPHLIMLDIMMPGKDGIELCKDIRDIPFLADSIITFLTARSEAEIKSNAMSSGADDYITKPIRPRELVDKVNDLIHLFLTKPARKI
jgi:two-component system, OmpR family, alkaline phosphatase synthesis response regulator PhoP